MVFGMFYLGRFPDLLGAFARSSSADAKKLPRGNPKPPWQLKDQFQTVSSIRLKIMSIVSLCQFLRYLLPLFLREILTDLILWSCQRSTVGIETFDLKISPILN